MQTALLRVRASDREFEVLPCLAIYGANAAGKSNVLLALEYVRDAARLSHSLWSPTSGTHLPQSGSPDAPPSRFEIDIALAEQRFRYGFSVNSGRFLDEWLYGFTGSRQHLLFERTTNGETSTVKTGPKLSGGSRRLENMSSRLRSNSLFLSLAAQENQPECLAIFKWFERDVNFPPVRMNADPFHASVTSSMVVEHEDFQKKLIDIMRIADSSIQNVIVSQAEEDQRSVDFFKTLPDGVREMFKESMKYKVIFTHKAGENVISLPFSAQSRGIQKVYSLAGFIMMTLEFGDLLVLDELEASMHPHLARVIVDMFQDPDLNSLGAQLLFVTHDTNMLDQSLLRRDQVWFVEKDACESHLYSLLDFSPRKDEDLERGYLRGRYGAIPIFPRSNSWLDALTDLDDDDLEPRIPN